MKRQISRPLSMVVLAVVAIVTAATSVAQAQTPVHIVAEIPFAFNVGDRVLPAGTYRVNRLLRDSNKVLVVRDLTGRGAVVSNVGLTAWTEGQPAETPTLVFRRYENHYFLAQVFMGEEKNGHALKISRLERSIAREWRRNRGIQPNSRRESALVKITGR